MDTVILGCTHYPLVRPLIQRTMGRGVEIVTSGEAIAAEVADELERDGIEAPALRQGAYHFLASGDPEEFRRLGTRFLQLPIARVGHVQVELAAGAAGVSRHDGRAPGALREVRIEPGLRLDGGRLRADVDGRHARDLHRVGGREGAEVDAGQGPRLGDGRVRDAARPPPGDRKQRDVTKGRPDGRTVEIQRLIGRALRGVVDFEKLGERTVWIDCDVLEADGGTRCAAITGGYVALELALNGLIAEGLLETLPLNESVAAVSCGIVEGEAALDLDYPEDSTAEVDMNVVMTGDGGLVEVQATAERTPLSRASLDELLGLAAARDRAAARGPARRRGADGLRGRMRLVLASRNAHKLRELGPLLEPNELVPMPDHIELPPEDGATFEENALGKARAVAAATGETAVADDSGIEAAALGGAPGIRSARYAGERATDEQNLAKLLREVPPDGDTRVAYVCALAMVHPGGLGGAWSRAAARAGSTHEPRGRGGFGYDPAFVPDDYDDGRTMAELSAEEKDAISHRGRAARALMELAPR